MSKLRKEMICLMERANYSGSTIRSYVHAVASLAMHYRKSPEVLSDAEIGEYLDTLRMRGLSWSSIHCVYSGIKWFCTHVLDRSWDQRQLPRPRREKRLPEILSQAEVKRLLGAIVNLKHQTVLMLMYSGGLRIGEVVRLRVKDIDSERMLIRIEQAKGRKDRYTVLSPTALGSLRSYWRYYHPIGQWLFEGMDKRKHWSISSARQVFKRAVAKAGITKRVGSHVLRHSFATHLLEQGVDTLTIKELLGHSQLRTTAMYLHVRQSSLSQLDNPLDRLMG
jgi:integrase/recombinase XerD